MIRKYYRLSEREVKRVLFKKKPFFSHHISAYTLPNTLGHARVAIILGGKQAPGSVNRNTWRRLMYTISSQYITTSGIDVVFLPKKGIRLNYKDKEQKQSFQNDIEFLWKHLR